MTARSFLVIPLVLAACGGSNLFTTLTATPSAGPPDTFDCVRAKLTELQYQQTSIDLGDRRITARQIDNKATRPDAQFRRLVNKLDIQATAAADGKTQLKVIAHTVGEYTTQRGPTENEEKASDDVNRAAQAVIQACGQP